MFIITYIRISIFVPIDSSSGLSCNLANAVYDRKYLLMFSYYILIDNIRGRSVKFKLIMIHELTALKYCSFITVYMTYDSGSEIALRLFKQNRIVLFIKIVRTL